MRRISWFNITSLTFGFAFLYLPILILIIFSFNESKLVTVWGGFSLKWYVAVFQDESYMNATWVTLRIALATATIALPLGVMAALVLARSGKFFGRTLFSGMVYAPMVMPEVIMGLSLLLLFIAVGVDRGFWTITLAHITFSMCYVCVVVSSGLSAMDRSQEEAAQDLGCPPFRSFFLITVPNITPSLISAWLLSFTLSLDDLVIASFTAGPGATTLPMKVFSSVRLGVSPEINAISTMLIGVVAIGVIAASLFSKPSKTATQ
jgi:putrescine transport system permease protein